MPRLAPRGGRLLPGQVQQRLVFGHAPEEIMDAAQAVARRRQQAVGGGLQGLGGGLDGPRVNRIVGQDKGRVAPLFPARIRRQPVEDNDLDLIPGLGLGQGRQAQQG